MPLIDNIDPTIRQAVQEELATLKASVTAAIESHQKSTAAAISKVIQDNGATRDLVQLLHKRVNDDPEFKITRAKLIAIAKSLGLE